MWKTVRENLSFVSLDNFHDDLWAAFFKTQKLYTTNIYISSGINFKMSGIKLEYGKCNSVLLRTNGLTNFMNFFSLIIFHIVRSRYKSQNQFPQVIRFDYRNQNFF
jgi:hypothetical protein